MWKVSSIGGSQWWAMRVIEIHGSVLVRTIDALDCGSNNTLNGNFHFQRKKEQKLNKEQQLRHQEQLGKV
jgi:hypothetical protein